jgi:hypothetical protein
MPPSRISWRAALRIKLALKSPALLFSKEHAEAAPLDPCFPERSIELIDERDDLCAVWHDEKQSSRLLCSAFCQIFVYSLRCDRSDNSISLAVFPSPQDDVYCVLFHP